MRKIAFVTYETPFAPAGGIAAVMGRLPEQVGRASGVETVVLTPFHHRIAKTADLPVERVAKLTFGGKSSQRAELLRHRERPVFHFIRHEDPRVFAGAPHPYRLSGGDLVRDSMLFGAAVVAALDALDDASEWALLLQDWEAATAALAIPARGAVKKSRFQAFLTMHNSYDSPAPDEIAAAAGMPALRGQTVLQRALTIVKPPVFTVSEQYALDLTADHLQSRIMADHLQTALRRRVVGVNNGPFVDLKVDAGAFAQALSGDFGALGRWKAEHRTRALAALDQHAPAPKQPVWGDRARFDRDPDACWIVMAGRDDPRQKGYDVAALGVREFLEAGGDARFFFFPVPGDEDLEGLEFLRRLAADHPEKVLVFPFIWIAGFSATLAGASFGLMPSFYEPFGMANEFYLQGTVGIGRATGGIAQQIVPLRSAASFSLAAQSVADRWHSSSSAPTGLLYRERVSRDAEEKGWTAINGGDYKIGIGRLETRARTELFQSMARELHLALEDAARLHRAQRHLYDRMLVQGILHVQQSFSWERAAEEYVRRIG
jgi:glycogen synthase